MSRYNSYTFKCFKCNNKCDLIEDTISEAFSSPLCKRCGHANRELFAKRKEEVPNVFCVFNKQTLNGVYSSEDLAKKVIKELQENNPENEYFIKPNNVNDLDKILLIVESYFDLATDYQYFRGLFSDKKQAIEKIKKEIDAPSHTFFYIVKISLNCFIDYEIIFNSEDEYYDQIISDDDIIIKIKYKERRH